MIRGLWNLGRDKSPELSDERTAVPELLAKLARSVRRSRELDAAAQAEQDPARIREAIVPEMRELVESTSSILDDIEERYRSESAESEDELNVDGMFGEAEPPARQEPESMADLCFVGRFELQQAVARLRDSLEGVERNELVARCARCRGSIVNVSSMIDRAVARLEGWIRVVDTVPELEESLAVRAAYAGLRDELDKISLPEGGPTALELDAARSALERLTTPRVAALLRVADRENVSRLHERVSRWVEEGGQDRTVGTRLWEEITFVAEMLLQVNNRQELLANDASTARRLLHRINTTAQDLSWVDRSFFHDVRQLRGRSDRLDAVLDQLERTLMFDLSAALAAVGEDLARASASGGTPGEEGEPAGHELYELDLDVALNGDGSS